MRFRAHLLAAAAVGALAYPRSPARAALVAAGGVLIDIDHYILYALRSGDWSLAGALGYEARRHTAQRRGDTRPRYGSLRSIAHQPLLTLPVAWLLALAWPALRPLALGLSVHLALDLHLPRFRRAVWRRAGGRCERCGLPGLDMGPYYLVPPHRGGKRWSLDNLVVLCDECARELFRRTAGRAPAGAAPAPDGRDELP
jgi:hypothetical protein